MTWTLTALQRHNLHTDPRAARLTTELEGIAERAHHLLQDRSANEILAGETILLWLETETECLLHGEEANVLTGTPLALAPLSEEEHEALYIFGSPSFAAVLDAFRDGIDLSGLDELPHATWPELFAVQALRDVAAAMDLEQKADSLAERREWLYAMGVMTQRSQAAVGAMEAICLAEQYTSIDRLAEQEAANRISLKNRQAAIKRHAKAAELKDELIRWYESGHYGTKADAVRTFIADRGKERILEETGLMPNNLEQTLRRWLYAHREPGADD